jgi:hypothetical protein
MGRADGCDVLDRTNRDAARKAESEGRRRNLEACRIFDACDSGLQFIQEAERLDALKNNRKTRFEIAGWKRVPQKNSLNCTQRV